MEEMLVDEPDIGEDEGEAPERESSPRMATGRVFFRKDGDRFDKGKNLTEIVVVPLENHVTNVQKLAEHRLIQSPADENEKEERRSRLIRAAKIHDQGKAWRLSLHYNEKSDEFVYSYAGHRFDVTDPDPYVQELVTLHHSFSVYEIARAVHRIKNAKASLPFEQELIEKIFPEDLYALEMCDQVVAEVETWALEGNASHRLFMDVKLIPDQEKGRFEVSPPFFGSESITLNVEYRTYKVDRELRKMIAEDMRVGNSPKVEKTGSKSTSKTHARGSQRNLRKLRDYLHSADAPLASKQKSEEVVLCPKS